MRCPDCGGPLCADDVTIERNVWGILQTEKAVRFTCDVCSLSWYTTDGITMRPIKVTLRLENLERDRGLYRRNGKTAISSAVLDGVPEEPVSGELRLEERQMDALAARGRKPK